MEQEVEIRLKVVTLQDVKQLQKISMETFSDTFKEANDEANLKEYLKNVTLSQVFRVTNVEF